MTRLKARAPRGERAYGKVPRNRGKNTTLIAAITPSKEPWASRWPSKEPQTPKPSRLT
jgi:hypothetical protein